MSHSTLLSLQSIGRPRARIQYTYPPSPTSSASGRDSPAQHWHPIPRLSLSQRIANLKAEVDAIEAELALKDGEEVHDGQPNAAEFIRELADVKTRLSKADSNKKEGGRGKLINAVLRGGAGQSDKTKLDVTDSFQADEMETDPTTADKLDMVKFTADIDRRLGTLEKVLGSSTTPLDEVRMSETVGIVTRYAYPAVDVAFATSPRGYGDASSLHAHPFITTTSARQRFSSPEAHPA